MSQIWTPVPKHLIQPQAPVNFEARKDLMGWGPINASNEERIRFAGQAFEELVAEFLPFFIAGQTQSGAGKTVRAWDIFRKVVGHDPDLTPQPTGNCVAAASDDVVEGTQAIQIAAGANFSWRPIYNPFHYYTGRELVGKGRLRGGAGSVGSWQFTAHKLYGAKELTGNLPAYNKRNVDAWGDGKAAEGQHPKDFMDEAAPRLIKGGAQVTTWPELRDALYGGPFLATIANNRGYTMKPDKDGYHRPSGNWSHQRSLWGYAESGKDWMAIKNQWGDVHGEIRDFETGELWPKGFLRVRLEDFIKYDLGMPGTECIIYSGFEGFPELGLNFGGYA